jgi:hypothetical protein
MEADMLVRLSKSAFWLAAIVIMQTASAAGARTVSIPFNAANFSDPLTIDNPYFPLIAGTTYTSRASTSDGCEEDVTTITYQTRIIDGVTTRVVHDQVFDGETCTSDPGALTEDTSDYYAQDNAGNVWYMGEDTFTCEGAGHCTPGEGAWIAGVNNAQPGIIMLAHPKSGDSYQQEFSAGIAQDQALVTAVGVTAKMTRDDAYQASYSNCLVTKEWTVLEPGAIEFKTYCPSIGVVQTVEHHGKSVASELTSISGTANALKFRKPNHR